MTDRDRERIDLRALDVDGRTTDRVMSAAMARILETPQVPANDVDELARRAVRPVLVAATLLVAAAACAIAFLDSRNDASSQPSAAVAAWMDDRHVPTNAELLLAFQGYSR